MKITQIEYDCLRETQQRYRTIMRWLGDKASLSNYDKTGITIETYGITDFLKIVCPDDFYTIKADAERKENERLKESGEKESEE